MLQEFAWWLILADVPEQASLGRVAISLHMCTSTSFRCFLSMLHLLAHCKMHAGTTPGLRYRCYVLHHAGKRKSPQQHAADNFATNKLSIRAHRHGSAMVQGQTVD